MLPRDKKRPKASRREIRFPFEEVGRAEAHNIVDTISASCAFNLVELSDFFEGPSNDRCTGLQDREVELVLDLYVLGVARLDARQLKAAGWRVEAGVEDRTVRFAGASQDVGRFFEKGDVSPIESQPPCDGAAHNPAPNDDDIEPSIVEVVDLRHC